MKAFAQAVPELPLRPACNDGDGPTLEREGGPFFKPNSPLNRDLYSDAPAGERITVAVRTRHSLPAAWRQPR